MSRAVLQALIATVSLRAVLAVVPATASNASLPLNASTDWTTAIYWQDGLLTTSVAMLRQASANSVPLADNVTLVGSDGMRANNGSLALQYAGVLTHFSDLVPSPVSNATNTTSGTNTTSAPWIALISCDPYNLTEINANASLSQSNISYVTSNASVFDLAYQAGAQAIILYSTLNGTCTIQDTQSPLTILTARNLQNSKTLQMTFQNVQEDAYYFNASMLNGTTSSIATALNATLQGNAQTVPTYLLAYLTAPSANSNDSSTDPFSSASFGPAPTSSTSTPTQSPSSGAATLLVPATAILCALGAALLVL
ncbi:uncharacterized protein L969DRAFT_84460 [Mixia osmundae IAM 14324]|uniref:PA domain-containing protein n=1 Tax=Mixia osmundae (strain CBS 9802 / IAM 14324 / JCM 22182 / KY 12970) TaxID=764103 RepID=G7DZE1_MIXOS|nr:uncharacterized protein L969DRAFT_84460 [Mixia osmundae IAM 14324]KEI42584.1 hypothetical protein L969DRAFT_84460 [Mixia osmundae IAM 14324]GAA95951.1 hypothetical protein E5Q_02609 [Mixia osmundae IAM 14324]